MKYSSQKKSGLLISGLLLAYSSAFAQNETDALRFSFTQPQGTARSMGFGSALGSVGGDFTSLSVNPAGIGIYRKSEAMFTPSLMFNSSSASGNAANGDATGARFAFSNAGIVWTTAARGKRYERSPWKAVSFGFGINRMADYTRDVTYGGSNTNSSGSWVFEQDANIPTRNVNDPSTLAYLGYQSYLLDTITVNGQFGYLSAINPDATHPINQSKTIKERGGSTELVVSFGGNYQEKLMLGATIGIPVIDYRRDQSFTESNLAAASGNYLTSYTYTENLRTSGLGINLKLGAIYKFVDAFRVGVALHTPSYIALTDVQDQNVMTYFTGNSPLSSDASENTFDYTLTTPWKGVASATAMLGKYGFITADYEYVDYRSTRFNFGSGNGDYQSSINDNIRTNYQGASNVRAGVEIKLDALSLRAGLGYYGNPYKSSVNKDGEHIDFSGGIGFRGKRGGFVDLAFVHHQYKTLESPYTLPTGYTSIYSPVVAAINNNQNNFAVTVGWKF